MSNVTVDFSKVLGKMKPVHGVNNGPQVIRQTTNKLLFTKAGIPFSRLHDTMYPYGSGHYVDIPCVFPDFDADPDDPESYDFALTDEYISRIIEVGTKVFYRLGVSIEHPDKKYNIFPPKDFQKWVKICEGIIRHYNEGFADGFHYNIEYWEIWNEPDLENRMWTGTTEEFCELYKVTATHLKSCFPNLKIGGAAFTNTHLTDFIRTFFESIAKDGKRVPLDFYSWHGYKYDPRIFGEDAILAKEILQKYGYNDTESILNEWNWVDGWDFVDYKTMHSMHGAAFIAGTLCVLQEAPLESAMFYDACPKSSWCSLFTFPTLEPKEGYYSILYFNELYKLGTYSFSKTDDDRLFSCCAKNENSAAVMIACYDKDKNKKRFTLDTELDISGFSSENGVDVEIKLTNSQNVMTTIYKAAYFGERFIPKIDISSDEVLLITLKKR